MTILSYYQPSTGKEVEVDDSEFDDNNTFANFHKKATDKGYIQEVEMVHPTKGTSLVPANLLKTAQDKGWKTEDQSIADTQYKESITPGAIESAARGVSQGVSLGFADELQAGLGAVARKAQTFGSKESEPISETYTKLRDAERERNKQAQEAHPYVYGGSELVGGLGVPVGSIAKGAGLAAKIGHGALTGAAIGGAAGAGYSEKPIEEELPEIVQGSAIGGAIGGALPLAGAAAEKITELAKKGKSSALKQQLVNMLSPKEKIVQQKSITDKSIKPIITDDLVTTLETQMPEDITTLDMKDRFKKAIAGEGVRKDIPMIPGGIEGESKFVGKKIGETIDKLDVSAQTLPPPKALEKLEDLRANIINDLNIGGIDQNEANSIINRLDNTKNNLENGTLRNAQDLKELLQKESKAGLVSGTTPSYKQNQLKQLSSILTEGLTEKVETAKTFNDVDLLNKSYYTSAKKDYGNTQKIKELLYKKITKADSSAAVFKNISDFAIPVALDLVFTKGLATGVRGAAKVYGMLKDPELQYLLLNATQRGAKKISDLPVNIQIKLADAIYNKIKEEETESSDK